MPRFLRAKFSFLFKNDLSVARFFSAAARIGAVLCLAFLLCAVSPADASVEVSSTVRGGFSQFRLLNAEIKPGMDLRYKLATRTAGTVRVTLRDESTGVETVLREVTYASAKNILVVVPGAMVRSDTQYTLDATITYKGSLIGTGRARFGYAVPVAKVEALSVPASFAPMEGDTLPVSFQLVQRANVYAYVCNASGTRVRVLCDGTVRASGAISFAWDGRNDAGVLQSEGDYMIEVSCSNAGGVSGKLTASTRLEGVAEGAIIGQRAGVILSAMIEAPAVEGETATLKLVSSAKGAMAVKIKDTTAGTYVKLNMGNASVGLNELPFDGSYFIGGHSYVFQIVLGSGKTIGKAQLSFVAQARPPVVLAFDAATTYRAGYGAYMEFDYTIKNSGSVYLQVLNSTNQVVASVMDGVFCRAGVGKVYWNGGDSNGKLLANDTYSIAFWYTNIAGTTERIVRTLAYSAVEGLPVAETQGSISRFMLLSDPELPERSPVTLRVVTTSAGTLQINLRRLDNNAAVTVYYGSLAAGTHDITLDGELFYSYAYSLDARYAKRGKVIGKANVSLHPKFVPPEITGFAVSSTFGGSWTEECRINLTMQSCGYLTVTAQDADGKVLCTLYNGSRTTAGAKSILWNGRLDDNTYAPEGTYRIVAQYKDDYGTLCAPVQADTELKKVVYPEGVYGYAYIGVGNYKTKIYINSEPGGGKRLGYAYARSSVFEILGDYGEYLYVRCSRMINEPITGYIKASEIERVAITSPYRIEIDISRTGPTAQTLYLYKDNVLIDTFRVSTGTKVGSTPLGDYLITDRLPYFYSGSARCEDALRVVGGVCIHRVPLVNGSYRTTSARLGSVASHGCIRIPVSKSEWFYERIPNTTPVTIFQ